MSDEPSLANGVKESTGTCLVLSVVSTVIHAARQRKTPSKAQAAKPGQSNKHPARSGQGSADPNEARPVCLLLVIMYHDIIVRFLLGTTSVSERRISTFI